MNLFKRISILLTALLLALGAAAFAACDDEPEAPTPGNTPSGGSSAKTTEYKVTVLYEDETPVEGVKVVFTLKSSNEEKGSATTGADGIATCTLESDTYYAAADESTLPSGFFANRETCTAKLPNKTITLHPDEGGSGPAQGDVLFTVTVLYPNGDPASGVRIGMCKGTQCVSFPNVTGADGKASHKLDAATSYTVQIIGDPPEGYTYDKDEHNYYMKDGQVVYVTDADPNVTITLKAV